MPHENTVFHAILKLVPWAVLDEAVARHAAAACARRFSFKDQIVAMLFAQLSGAASLREVVGGLQSHKNRLYHLGVEPARRSSLADANRARPAAIFEDLLAAMIAGAERAVRRTMKTKLIDSTNLMLGPRSVGWARFSDTACGAKLHVVYDPDGDCPLYAAVTPLRVNDITAAHAMPVEPGATYVFDLGYYDYGWWAKLDGAGCRIVTRLKQNTPLREAEDRPVPAGGAILCDRVGFLPQRLGSGRRNPMRETPVREVQVQLDTGPVLRVVSNDLEASAQEIADLYKRRWQIELFFRWVKQTLRITRFLGTSENAVRIQIATALIAFLLLRTAQKAQAAVASPLAFARLVRLNLMHRRALNTLDKPPPKPKPATGQGVLFAA